MDLMDIFAFTIYTESNKNLADIFTKALAVPAHQGLARRLLGGNPLP
jgi:hypothetical protein